MSNPLHVFLMKDRAAVQLKVSISFNDYIRHITRQLWDEGLTFESTNILQLS